MTWIIEIHDSDVYQAGSVGVAATGKGQDFEWLETLQKKRMRDLLLTLSTRSMGGDSLSEVVRQERDDQEES